MLARFTAVISTLVFVTACRPAEPAAAPSEGPASELAADEPASDEPSASEPTATPVAHEAALLPPLRQYVDGLAGNVESIPAERRESLDPLAQYIVESRAAGTPVRLVFICTHNSRRSHMSQLWAAAAAAWYGIDGVETFSGGTEATAFNPRAVAAMQRAGFEITGEPADDNPRYEVRFGPEAAPITAFSKVWSDAPNPTDAFAAVMTCSQADQACPFVRGASFRVAVPYDDPKQADGSPEEARVYDERTRQIAAEMFYVFGQVANAK